MTKFNLRNLVRFEFHEATLETAEASVLLLFFFFVTAITFTTLLLFSSLGKLNI